MVRSPYLREVSQPVNQPGRVARIYDYLRRDICITGTQVRLAEPGDHNEQDKPKRRITDLDAWQRAPRWALRIFAVALMAALAFYFGKVSELQSKEEARIQAALADAPTKTQVAMLQRIADIEAVNRSREQTDRETRATLTKMSDSVGQLAVQVGRLAVQVELMRKEKP
jgi:hypothetical protein